MINNGKAKIQDTFGKLIISIPSKKNWFALIFGTAWLGGWYFGFKSASSALLSGGANNIGVNGFMIFWLIGWSVGGIAIISMLLWGYFGQEQLISDNGEVNLNKTVFGIGLKIFSSFLVISSIIKKASAKAKLAKSVLII